MSTAAKYTQAERFARIDFDNFPNQEPLLLVSLVGTEGLSQLFSFRLETVAPIENKFDPETVLGKLASLTLGNGTAWSEKVKRTIRGMISVIRELRDDANFRWYELEFVPPIWIRGQNRRHRIFENKTLPKLTEALLNLPAVGSSNVDVEGLGAGATRNYAVQYAESDLDCAMRFLEEDGAYFYFPLDDHDGRLFARSNSLTAPEHPKDSSIAYLPVAGQTLNEPRIWSFRSERKLTALAAKVMDCAFQMPGKYLSNQESLPKIAAGTRLPTPANLVSEEQMIVEYPAGYVKYYDSISQNGGSVEDLSTFSANVQSSMTKFAKARAGEIALSAVRFDGASNSTGLVPGYRFTLTGHSDSDADFLVTHVDHELKMSPFASANGPPQVYSNRFSAIPATLPFHPARTTPRPRIHGHHTAVVVGVDGTTATEDDHIFTDKYGRVRVKFPWCANDNNSCWIRVAHASAGKRWGSQFVPRVGQEVVVGFEDGDPDRPLIYGSVYNQDNPPPHDPAQFKQVSGIMSITNGSNLAQSPLDFSGMAIDDAPDKEVLQLRSAQTLIQAAGGDIVTVAPDSLNTYVSNSRVSLLGGMLGLGLPGVGAVNALGANLPTAIVFKQATIEATDGTGAWKPVAIDRLYFTPFELNANYGSQVDIVAGSRLDFHGIKQETFGNSMQWGAKFRSYVKAGATSLPNLFSLAGGLVAKMESVSGHSFVKTDAYAFSRSGKGRFQIDASIPALSTEFVLNILGVSMQQALKTLAGVSSLQANSACRQAVDILTAIMPFMGRFAANIEIGRFVLQKVKTLRDSATTLKRAAASVRNESEDVSESWLPPTLAMAIAQSITESIEGLRSTSDVLTGNPWLQPKRDSYSFTDGHYLIETKQLLVAKANCGVIAADNLLSLDSKSLAIDVHGDNDLGSRSKISATLNKTVIHVGPDRDGSRLEMAPDSITLRVADTSLVIRDGSIRAYVNANDGLEESSLELNRSRIEMISQDDGRYSRLQIEEGNVSIDGAKVSVEALAEYHIQAPQSVYHSFAEDHQ